MAHATALLLCAVMNALSDEPLHNSERSRAQRRLQKQPCTELQSTSPGVAPPRIAPGARMRGREKCRSFFNDGEAEFSERGLRRQASPRWAGRARALRTGPGLVRRRAFARSARG